MSMGGRGSQLLAFSYIATKMDNYILCVLGFVAVLMTNVIAYIIFHTYFWFTVSQT